MPSDSNGVYSLPNGYLAVTGEVIQASQHNPPLEDLGTAMSARLMRSGAAPMTGALKVADGSVGSPAVQFNSASGSGFYKTANGIGVAINGTLVTEFTSSGLSRMLGEMIPWTLLAAPSGWVLPYGQTLNRTTYAALWVIAQTEIAAGNTFYNNGDGSTTFGVGDMRGRVVAGKDNMGGTAASRLTTAGSSINGVALGATGGAQNKSLITANLPAYTPSGTVTNGAITNSVTGGIYGGTGTGGYTSGAFSSPLNGAAITVTSDQAASTFTGAAQGGTGTAFATAPPTMITNYILFAGA